MILIILTIFQYITCISYFFCSLPFAVSRLPSPNYIWNILKRSQLPVQSTRLLNRSRFQQTTLDGTRSIENLSITNCKASSRPSSQRDSANGSPDDQLFMLDKTLRNSMIQDVQYCKQQLLQLRSILQEVNVNEFWNALGGARARVCVVYVACFMRKKLCVCLKYEYVFVVCLCVMCNVCVYMCHCKVSSICNHTLWPIFDSIHHLDCMLIHLIPLISMFEQLFSNN